MASEPRNYPDYVFVAYDEDFSAQTYDIAVSLEPGNLVGRPVKYIRHDLNTCPAPAATDTGLVTVAWQRNIGGSDVENWVSHFILDLDAALGCPVRELVTRSQAEELLAAERAEKDGWKELHDAAQVAVKERTEACNSLYRQNTDLEAKLAAKDAQIAGWTESGKLWTAEIRELQSDNAALTARIKELEWKAHNAALSNKIGEDSAPMLWSEYAETLEAKLSAAEKALEFYADASKWNDGYFKSEDDGTVLRAYPSSIEKDQGDKARAVLGGKPS